ncbi:thrombospondin type 3 repeat-containing protein, partial [Candidatus Woesearchaeota archaeon]|nr:thrombospondin type 3 repeat-containing protein [Candidatus Woesearchaeota archaeon]
SCIAAYQSSCTYCTTSCQQQTVQGAYFGDLVVNGAEECDGGTTCTSECKKDTDNDGLIDTADNCPSTSNANQVNTDGDAEGDACDADDDNDGVLDTSDLSPLDSAVCGDVDGDSCDDCGISESQDTDVDTICDLGDTDDDNDGVLDVNDCAGGSKVCSVTELCANSQCVADADSDGIADSTDNCPLDSNAAQTNTDGDAQGDLCDTDDDNDGILDTNDSAPLNAQVCGDTDADSCDDCGPDETVDTDADSFCNAGDADMDGDYVLNPNDASPLNKYLCGDGDSDTCDDCSSGTWAPRNDGTDTDADGLCDAGDTSTVMVADVDADNDGIADAQDSAPADAAVCADTDGDSCDDCSSGVFNPLNDGTDTDNDSLCDLGDDDKDGDKVVNTLDSNPINSGICLDLDGDSCDDCSVSGNLNTSNDGTDTDSDGLCDLGDSDANGDGIADATSVCGNGIKESGEQCDDGYTVDGDGCSTTCTMETLTTVSAFSWDDNSLTQEVPLGASSTRLQLPAALGRIYLTRIGAFGSHQGGHAEGLDHEWIEIKKDAPIAGWADGVVTEVKNDNPSDATSPWRITVSYGDGLFGGYMSIATPLVVKGQRVKSGDPIGWGCLQDIKMESLI